MNTIKNDYQNYLKLAQTGYYPLFFNDWVKDSLVQEQKLNYKNATHKVKHVFNQLARHKTTEKKKTALISMDRVSREEFIRSFIKIVEHETLKDIKSLQ